MIKTEELFYVKTKKGWRCQDRQGKSAEGITKQLARNQYYLMYRVGKNIVQPGIDMSKFNVDL